jgi:hypothetical protein
MDDKRVKPGVDIMANKSFTFDGVDLSGYGLQVNDYTIPEMANTIAGEHSAMFGDSHFTTVSHTKRGISLVCSQIKYLRSTISPIGVMLGAWFQCQHRRQKVAGALCSI